MRIRFRHHNSDDLLPSPEAIHRRNVRVAASFIASVAFHDRAARYYPAFRGAPFIGPFHTPSAARA